MFGCIGRIVVVCVLLVLGAVAYATRDRWGPSLEQRIGMRPSRSAAFAGWQPVTPAGAERLRAAIDSLRRPTGPAFINVRAADLVAYAVEPVVRRLAPDSGKAVPATANAGENVLMIRGAVKMSDLGGAAALGPLAGVLEGTQTVELRGRVDVASPGHATFQVTRIAIGSLVLPSAAIGRVVQQIVPRHDRSQPEDVVPFTIAPEIADVRITHGRVTLYKAAK